VPGKTSPCRAPLKPPATSPCALARRPSAALLHPAALCAASPSEPTPWPPPIRRLGRDRRKIDSAGSFPESSHASSADSRRLELTGTAPPPSTTTGRPGPPSMGGYRPCPAAVRPSLCSPSPPLSFPPLFELVAVPIAGAAVGQSRRQEPPCLLF
jgi:hypothetical protein